MRHMQWLTCGLLGLGLGAGCGDDPPVVEDDGCNPLGSANGCVLPWPSSYYEVEDATSPTGRRLQFPAGALPTNVDGVAIDPSLRLNQRTGFSPQTQIVVTFPAGIDDSNLLFIEQVADSLTDVSPTVIFDLDRGERIAHFAEIDKNVTSGVGAEQAMMLRPAVRLRGGGHYAVALRQSLRGQDGLTVPRSPAFEALVTGLPTGNAKLDAQAATYQAMFAALAADGIPTSDLVLAWDFHIADDDAAIADPLAARDAAMAAVGDGSTVAYTVELNEAPDSRDPGIARRVNFTYESPRVAGPNFDGFVRDGNGRPTVGETTEAPAIALVPGCATAANKAGLVIYGHGFFGNLAESEGGTPRRFAQETCNIVVGGLWRGMSTSDVGNAALALNELNRIPGFAEGVWQGIIDFMVLTKLAKTRLADELFVDENGNSIVDTTRVHYYGISQGHILGSSLVAYDPTIERAAFHVGGANWSMMFERSKNWLLYSQPLVGAYGSQLSGLIGMQVIQLSFDLIDGGTVAPYMLNGGLPGTPSKQYLQHMTVDDCQVPNIASLYQARAIGLPVLTPTVALPWGLTETAGPATSALVIFDEQLDPPPPADNTLFGYDNDAHGETRGWSATVDQIDQFFDQGSIVNTCDGACDCGAGLCGVRL